MKKKHKILIVEDSMTAMLYTSNIVREAGCDLVEAINGKEALQKLRNDSFDMIISDILMPEMDGFQLLKHVKENPDLQNIPFIFHTATYNSDKDKDFGFELGVDAYIHKFKNPTELSELINRIFKELESQKFISNKPKIEQKEEVFKLYSERLINKLEKKVLNLENENIEHKKAEEDLRQFKKIVDSTSGHMSFIDTNYVYREVNNAYIKAHKKKREEVIGHTIAELLGKEIFENVIKEKIDRCFSGEVVRYENWFDFTGIGRRYMDISYYPYFDKEKQISGVIVDSQDITQRKKAETKLANKTMLLDNITNRASNVSIITTDLNLKITSYNPYAEKFFGYSAGQVIGKTVHEMHFMENIEPERLTKAFKIVNKTGEYNYIVQQQLPDGKRVLSSRVTKILNPDGKLTGYSLFTHDVTKQVLAEETLKASEERFRSVFSDISNIAVQGYDKNRKVTFWNKASETLYGYSQKEAINKKLEDLIIPPEMRETVISLVDNWHENNIQIPSGELTLLKKDGSPIQVFSSHVMIEKSDGEKEMFCIDIDITERKQAEKALQAESSRFQTTMDSIDASVYVADMNTHELLFINKAFNNLVGGKIGDKCYSVVQKGQTSPCSFCTNHLLLDKNGNPKEPYVWEFQNTITKQWYQCRDQAIRWTDGRLVRLEIATDITERKIFENQLIESKEFTENLLETANSIVITLDVKANITTFNKHIEQLTGYKKEEVLGKNWFDIFIPDRDKKSVPKVFKKALDAMPEVSQHQNPIIIKSGEERLINWSNNLIFDSQGNKNGLLSIGVDITDRKKAEETLKASEERFHTVADFAYDWQYWLSPQNEFIYISPSCKRITGYSPNEFKQNPELLTSIIHKDDVDNWKNHKHLAFNKAEIETIEFRIITKSGEECWIGHVCQTVYNDNGVNIGIRGSNRDITKQKITEQALKTSEDRLSKTLIAANDGMWDWDLITNKVYFDSRYYEMAGYTADEFPHEFDEFQKRIHPDDVENVMVQAQQHLKGKTARFNVEFRFKKKNGDWLWVLGRGLIVERDKNNKPLRFIGTHTDITERKEAEKAIQKQNIELQERNEDLDAFSHTVAHEFKNPLGSIIGFTELLIENCSEDEVRKYLSIIINSGQKMHQIVDSLLLLANIRKAEIVVEKLNMNDIVSVSIERLNLLIEKNKAEIKLSETWPDVIGYGFWIEEVWINYLSNAIKYGGSPPIIEIGFDTDSSKGVPKGMLRFWIKDNGPGISLENQKVLFKKFERLDQVKTEGHGLGLSIVQRIIKKLGGQLGVESELGKGSLFYFTLPCSGKTEKNRTIKNKISEKIEKIKSGKLKLLIVDDVESVNLHLEIITSELCKETLHATNGMDAVKICKNNPDIDLVLMDIKLPKMNGYEATKQIRKFNKNVIIIAQSAYVMGGDLEKALEAGCDDFISKPIKQNELLEKIEKLLS